MPISSVSVGLVLKALLKNPLEFPEEEAHFLLTGPQGNLEVLTQAVENSKGVAVICHPHPLYQGTMHNKVVYTLARAFQRLGVHSVRFNYRGVGYSEGEFGDSIGEIADLLAVLAWLDKVLQRPRLWLAGFSFGSYIAASGALQHGCEQLYSIAPAVTHQDFSQLGRLSCPWVVIQGEADEVIPTPEVLAWYKAHSAKQPGMSLLTLPEGSHFFHGELMRLRTMVVETFAN